MKSKRVLEYFAVAVCIFAASIMSACGSKDTTNSNVTNSTSASADNANAGPVETKNRDMSPVTIKIADIFAETKASPASSVREKYLGREMTITEGVLYELESDSLKVGLGQNPDFGVESSAPQYFVTCSGKVSDYTADIADSVDRWRKAGQAKSFPVKGVFKEASSYNNKHWVILEPCALIKS